MHIFKKLILLLFLISISASAQKFTNPRTVELGGEMAYTSQSSEGMVTSVSSYAFNPYVGIMIAGGFELGFKPGIISTWGDNFSSTVFNIYIAPSYNFNTKSNVYPYVEAEGGYNATDDRNGFGYGGSAGLKVTIGTSSLFLVKFEYLHQTFNSQVSSGSDPEIALNSFFFGLGFRVLITGKEEVKK